MDVSTNKRISEEQKEAVNKIKHSFLVDVLRWAILLAQMQSGKSDTYWFVAFEMLRLKKVKKVIVFSGFQDTDLVSQLKNYTPSLKLYRRYLEEDLHLSLDERMNAEDLFNDNNIQIVCGPKLSKRAQETITDSLVIWDESHYAQNRTNRTFQFLSAIGITADGDASKLADGRNNYVLSVSATPYSEISDAIHEKQDKKIVKMKPGYGYVSVKDYYESKRLVGVEKNKFMEILENAIKKQLGLAVPTYSLVRIRDDKKTNKLDYLVAIANRLGIDYVIIDSEQKKNNKKNGVKTHIQSFDELVNAPKKPTLVLIKGMLRMGKRVPKEHISFAMETSEDPNTDVILQGLLGRMCGYHTNNNIVVYISDKVLNNKRNSENEIERYIRLMDGETDEVSVMPQKARNLTGVKQINENGWYVALPIVFLPSNSISDCDDNDPDHELYQREQIIRTIKQRIGSQSETIINHNSAEKTEELLKQVTQTPFDSDSWTPHNIAKQNGEINKTFENIPRLIAKTLEQEGEYKINYVSGSGCGFKSNNKTDLPYWYFNTNNYADLGLPRGTIVLQGRTRTASEYELKTLALQKNIAQTSGLEVFTSYHEDGTAVVGNGSYSIRLPVSSWNSVDIMQRSIDELVEQSLKADCVCERPRCINSNRNSDSKWQGIIVSELVLNSLKKNGSITKYIKEKYSVDLKIKGTPGNVPIEMRELGQLRLSKIEW